MEGLADPAQAANTRAISRSRAAASVASKADVSGASTSKTAIRAPEASNTGTTISLAERLSQAMWPGKAWTSGTMMVSRAIAAGLTFRPLATTVQDLLAWFRSLPAERQAKLGAGITREKEAEVLKAWHAQQG